MLTIIGVITLVCLAGIGSIVVLGGVADSWRNGWIAHRRERIREWSANARVAPLWSLRFRLGVRLLKPRLDRMYLVHNEHYKEHEDDYSLHHIYAISKLRDWRSMVHEQISE